MSDMPLVSNKSHMLEIESNIIYIHTLFKTCHIHSLHTEKNIHFIFGTL